MGWSFKWVSSHANDFNYDYHVSFTPEQQAKGEAYYNYATARDERVLPGRRGSRVPHLFLLCARARHDEYGLSPPDLVPKGRDEAELP